MEEHVTIINEEVSRYFGLDPAEVFSNRRHEHLIFPRFIAITIAFELTPFSYNYLGKLYNKHHGSIKHAKIALKGWIATDKRAKKCFEEAKRAVLERLNLSEPYFCPKKRQIKQGGR